jgi:carboxypeptidase D
VLTIGKEPRYHLPGRPEFKYIANMHGNEVMGREALLHLSAVLVHNYDRNLYIQRLLDTTRMHFM